MGIQGVKTTLRLPGVFRPELRHWWSYLSTLDLQIIRLANLILCIVHLMFLKKWPWESLVILGPLVYPQYCCLQFWCICSRFTWAGIQSQAWVFLATLKVFVTLISIFQGIMVRHARLAWSPSCALVFCRLLFIGRQWPAGELLHFSDKLVNIKHISPILILSLCFWWQFLNAKSVKGEKCHDK